MKNEFIHMRIDPLLKSKAQTKAAQQKTTLSDKIREWLTEYIEE